MGVIRAGVFLAAAVLACSDTLYLKSGNEYAGVFVSGNKERIRFDTGAGVVRAFRTQDVDRIQFGTEAAVPDRQSAPSAPAPAAANADRAQTVASEDRAESSAQVINLEGNAAPSAVPGGPPTPNSPYTTIAPGAGDFPRSTIDRMGDIDSEYTSMGAETGVLGSARGPEQRTADGQGAVRFYRNGAIYWRDNTGAHAVYGPIRDTWMRSGGERSPLGYPISDESDSNGGYDRMQNFEHGSISWNQQRGASVQYTGQ